MAAPRLTDPEPLTAELYGAQCRRVSDRSVRMVERLQAKREVERIDSTLRELHDRLEKLGRLDQERERALPEEDYRVLMAFLPGGPLFDDALWERVEDVVGRMAFDSKAEPGTVWEFLRRGADPEAMLIAEAALAEPAQHAREWASTEAGQEDIVQALVLAWSYGERILRATHEVIQAEEKEERVRAELIGPARWCIVRPSATRPRRTSSRPRGAGRPGHRRVRRCTTRAGPDDDGEPHPAGASPGAGYQGGTPGDTGQLAARSHAPERLLMGGLVTWPHRLLGAIERETCWRLDLDAGAYPDAVDGRLTVARRHGDRAFLRHDNPVGLLEETPDVGVYALLELQRLPAAGALEPAAAHHLFCVAVLRAGVVVLAERTPDDVSRRALDRPQRAA